MSRPISFTEEEIIVKPSTELIADEYEHFREDSSCSILVHTFVSDDKREDVDAFVKTLDDIGLKVDSKNQHSLDTDDCLKILDTLQQAADKSSGLILLFSGYTAEDGSISMYDGCKITHVNMDKIWAKFYSYRCIELKNKPKIFIFNVTKLAMVQTDGRKKYSIISYELAYETPNEADILLVYNKSEGRLDIAAFAGGVIFLRQLETFAAEAHRLFVDVYGDNAPSDFNEFVPSLCDIIKEFGDSEDIMSLVTQTNAIDCNPLMVSTLTRKFYFTASEVRGFHLTLQKNTNEVKNHLLEVKTALTATQELEKKSKKPAFLSSFSFRKKQSETKPVRNQLPATVQPKIENPTKKIPIKKPVPKISTKPVEVPKPASSMKPSKSKTSLSSDGRRSSQEKPKWRNF